MKIVLGLSIALVVAACMGAFSGCAAEPARVETGDRVAPPAGFVDLCQRDQFAPECTTP